MKEIPLTKGTVALVDDTDYEYLSQFKWHNSHGYAKRNVIEKGKQVMRSMQSYIMASTADFVVDHVDRNPLNNQRSNLRLSTKAQNNCNTKRVVGPSGYRGVGYYYDKRGNKPPRWQVNIVLNGKRKFLGLFDNAEIAARVYDIAAKELHGEFAVLNFAS